MTTYTEISLADYLALTPEERALPEGCKWHVLIDSKPYSSRDAQWDRNSEDGTHWGSPS